MATTPQQQQQIKQQTTITHKPTQTTNKQKQTASAAYRSMLCSVYKTSYTHRRLGGANREIVTCRACVRAKGLPGGIALKISSGGHFPFPFGLNRVSLPLPPLLLSNFNWLYRYSILVISIQHFIAFFIILYHFITFYSILYNFIYKIYQDIYKYIQYIHKIPGRGASRPGPEAPRLVFCRCLVYTCICFDILCI